MVDLSQLNTPIRSLNKFRTKLQVLARLLAVADYVNDRDGTICNAIKYTAYSNVPNSIKEIFKHNGYEQALINFFK